MYASLKYPSRFSPASRTLPLSRQRGAVLILALLIVALVAGLGIKFASDYQLGLARAEGRWNGAQARVYSFSGEGVALTLLSKDNTPNYDYQDEWPDFVVPTDGGTIAVRIIDANSQLNLNNLLISQPNQPILNSVAAPLDSTRYTPPQRMFIRLLQLFPDMVHSTNEAVDILEAIVDWADGDDTLSGPNSAENSYYLGLADPYLPANVGFRSVEELQLVRGITPELMKALRPYITIISSSKGMNVNTMQPLLYRCINVSTDLKPLGAAEAEKLMGGLQQGPYKDMGEFEAEVNKVLAGAGGVDLQGLSTSTDMVWLQSQADIGSQRRMGRSLLERGTPLFKVIRREEIY
ncbi:MAG TPA: type II secretion system minor pseudopilin GspK [Cellvibrio sp.]|nr:type II secretion system minor pseudopilin GspK [Cellvibrio sp.]